MIGSESFADEVPTNSCVCVCCMYVFVCTSRRGVPSKEERACGIGENISNDITYEAANQAIMMALRECDDDDKVDE
jgi:hypothetical protein